MISRQPTYELTDPMPDTLEAWRAELDHWEPRQYEGQPGSIWWEQVRARIEGLRHRENRLLSVQTPMSVVNNLLGPNTRINHNSVDQSANLATVNSLRRQSEARRFLAPELQRTIDRVLYIHGCGKSRISHLSSLSLVD